MEESFFHLILYMWILCFRQRKSEVNRISDDGSSNSKQALPARSVLREWPLHRKQFCYTPSSVILDL